jgi:hypothetical protein
VYTVEFVRLDALVERWAREPEEARRRVVEAWLGLASLERDVDGVRNLRRQLVERERGDEAEDALRDAL